MGYRRENILGVPITLLSKEEVYNLLNKTIAQKQSFAKVSDSKPLFLITAYSESLLEVRKNSEFKKAFEKADYILPDGVSVLEAADYLSSSSQSLPADLWLGLKIGAQTLVGKYSKNRITGVGLVREILEVSKGARGTKESKASKKTFDSSDSFDTFLSFPLKVFLLGGFGDVSKKLAEKYHTDYYDGQIAIKNVTQKQENSVIAEINNAKPDILLVSFGRFQQEIWIAKHLDQLYAKVVIGVGSSFDEILGEGKWAKKVPTWIETMGLKWLWRITIEPSHIVRAWNAFPIFPLRIFLEKRNRSITK